MKINSIRKIGDEHFELDLSYLFRKNRVRYAIKSSRQHDEYSWRDSCEWCGSRIDKVLNWMSRNEISFFKN